MSTADESTASTPTSERSLAAKTVAARPSEAAILGLDNVVLELPLAGVGSRILAVVIDSALLFLLLSAWWLIGAVTGAYLELGMGWLYALITLGAFLMQWGYFSILEIQMDGQTPGKRALDLRVVTHHGGRASTSAILVRNFLRGVDALVGFLIMAIDGRSRRLGDFVAGTLVVHERDPILRQELRLRRLPTSWGAREAAVVESFLLRAERLEPPRAEDFARRLLVGIDRLEPGFLAGAGVEPTSGANAVVALRRALGADEAAAP